MAKDHPGNMLKQELIQIQIIRYTLFIIIEFNFFIQNFRNFSPFFCSRLCLKAFGEIPELVDMLQLTISHSLKEIAQVIFHNFTLCTIA